MPAVSQTKVRPSHSQEPDHHTGGNGAATMQAWSIQSPVLVLNLDYVPINICTVRRAIVLLGKGKAEHLENHRGQVHTPSAVIDAPSIIRLAYLVKRPFLPRKLSKKEVFLRDRVYLPVLQQKDPGPDLGPRDTTPAERDAFLDKRGGRLSQVQPAEGGPHPGGGQYEAGQGAQASGAQSLPDSAAPFDIGRVGALYTLDREGVDPEGGSALRRYLMERTRALAGRSNISTSKASLALALLSNASTVSDSFLMNPTISGVPSWAA